MRPLRLIRWAIIAALFLLLVLIALSLVSLRDRVDNLGSGSPTGPVWFVTGIEFDTLQLQIALGEYSAGQLDAEGVNERLDLLWSRLLAVREGETAAKLREYEIDTSLLDDLLAVLQANEQGIVSLTNDTRSAPVIEDLRARIDEFAPELRLLSLAVLDGSSNEARGWREELVFVSNQNRLLIALVVGAFVVLTVLMFIENLRTRGSLREKEALLREATAANEAKSQFISVMNHELRTPLASIRGAVGLLNASAGGGKSEQERRLLSMAQRNCEHLSVLIQDILDVEKFTSGRFDINAEPVNVSKLLVAESVAYSESAALKGIALSVAPLPAELICSVDTTRLKQVMGNLISNAIKFSDAGSSVDLSAWEVDKRVVICVADDGIGIPLDAQGKIFDPFFQVDSSNERKAGGTGLGLSISQSIVTAMGGKIWVESAPDKGSRFYLSFPVHNAIGLSVVGSKVAAA